MWSATGSRLGIEPQSIQPPAPQASPTSEGWDRSSSGAGLSPIQAVRIDSESNHRKPSIIIRSAVAIPRP
jgi:hypothetical protein